VTEGRMAEIVRQRQGFGEVLIEAECARDRPGDLGDFQRVCKPGAVMIPLMGDENLGFLLQAAKRRSVNDPVTVTLKRRAGGRGRLFMVPALGSFPVRREFCSLFHCGKHPYLYPMNQVTLTQNAADRIKAILAKQAEATMLRVSVDGGGCSGFQYKLELTEDKTDKEEVFKDAVVTDNISLPFLAGSTVKFDQGLIGSEFKIENPNAVSGCGCGTSFSV